VCITESSKLGSSKYTITLNLEGDTGKYEVPDNDENHYGNGSWDEVDWGKTVSGKSFVAKQKIAHAPSWLGCGASIAGRSGLQGRLSQGGNSATFTTSMTVLSPGDGDELEIVQRGEMKRRAGMTELPTSPPARRKKRLISL